MRGSFVTCARRAQVWRSRYIVGDAMTWRQFVSQVACVHHAMSAMTGAFKGAQSEASFR